MFSKRRRPASTRCRATWKRTSGFALFSTRYSIGGPRGIRGCSSRVDKDRISRHYYDVAVITATEVGQSALVDTDLLDAVRNHNLVAFRQRKKRFEEAVPGSMRLVPQAELRAVIERDYRAMQVNPYMGWQMQSGMNLWATTGYGWGEVEIDDEAADTQASDLTQRMVAAGASGPLVSSDQLIGGGTTSLRLKGETAFTWADIEGSGPLEGAKLSASRQRLMLEGVYVKKLASGATFTPSIEVGMRHDGGDGETGSSVETGGAVRYADAASGLTVEGRARTVLAHRDDYEEWGVSGLVQLDPGAAGLGFALSLQPAWGQAASGVRRLWDAGVTGLAADDQTARVKARIAYGIGTTWGGRGVLRPYTDVSLSGEGSRRLSVGGRFDIGSSVRMSLEGVHSRPAHGANSHGVFLRGALNW